MRVNLSSSYANAERHRLCHVGRSELSLSDELELLDTDFLDLGPGFRWDADFHIKGREVYVRITLWPLQLCRKALDSISQGATGYCLTDIIQRLLHCRLQL